MTTKPDGTDNQAAIERTRQAVTRYATAWLAGDRPALAACYHEDFTLHYFGSNPLAGDHSGKMAALTILAEVTRRTNRKLLGIIDIMAGPSAARSWSASASSATARLRNSNGCWSMPCATDCSRSVGYGIRIRPRSTPISREAHPYAVTGFALRAGIVITATPMTT
jgi:hypothetical protein